MTTQTYFEVSRRHLHSVQMQAQRKTKDLFRRAKLTRSRVQLSTGVDIHYVARLSVEATPRNGIRIGRALVLLHGYSDSWHSFEEMLALLPWGGCDLPVFVPDLRGHGGSNGPASNAYAQADFAGDVAAFMNAMRIDRAVLVGHSMGGLIAHRAAVQFPERVEKLVLISTAASMVGHPTVAALRPGVETMPEDGPAPAHFVHEFQLGCFYSDPSPEVLYRFTSESQRLRGAVWKDTLRGLGREDHRSLLPDVTAPTLILWGEEDDVFGHADQQELATLLPNSELITYPDAGHALNVERADDLVRDIGRFLRR